MIRFAGALSPLLRRKGSNYRSAICRLCGTGAMLCAFSTAVVAAEAIGDEAMIKAPEVLEHTIDFLVALHFGLFAAVGYFAKDGLVQTRTCWRCLQIVAGMAFIVASVISLFFAYHARLELMQQLAGGSFSFEELENYVRQALTLVVSAAFALAFVIIGVATKAKPNSVVVE